MVSDNNLDSKEDKLLQSLYLILLYISGCDEHNEYLANSLPERSREWQSKETFVDLSSWIGLDFRILDRLKEEGFLYYPQEGSGKRRTYIKLNKIGMKRAREILLELNLSGAEDALLARSRHEEYINHKNRIELAREHYD